MVAKFVSISATASGSKVTVKVWVSAGTRAPSAGSVPMIPGTDTEGR